MQITSSVAGPIVSLSAFEVRWILRMIAESLLLGLHLYEDGQDVPEECPAWLMEHVCIRWVDLITAAASSEQDEEFLFDMIWRAAEAAYALGVSTDPRRGGDFDQRVADTRAFPEHARNMSWRNAPGVLPVHMPGTITPSWFGNAVFEYARRLAIPALRHRPWCVEAAAWALAPLPRSQWVWDLKGEHWAVYRRPVLASAIDAQAA